MRLFGRHKGPLPPSRQNTQHFVAAVTVDDTKSAWDHLKGSFRHTSELPCDYWESEHVLLGANYPDCIVEGRQFVGLCSGLPYCHSTKEDVAHTITVIQQAIPLADNLYEDNKDFNWDNLQTELASQLLLSLRGHWAMVLCHKATETLLVWNDAFGFMPVFSYQPPSGETSHAIQAVSSYWDCLVPRNLPAATGEQGRDHDQSLLLEWNEAVLAEYILFGTTIRNETFLQGLTNLEPGSCMVLERVEQDERVVKSRTQQYVQSYGACEELIKDEESIPPATMTANQSNARSTVETNDNQRSAPDTHTHINQLQERNGKWYSH